MNAWRVKLLADFTACIMSPDDPGAKTWQRSFSQYLLEAGGVSGLGKNHSYRKLKTINYCSVWTAENVKCQGKNEKVRLMSQKYQLEELIMSVKYVEI